MNPQRIPSLCAGAAFAISAHVAAASDRVLVPEVRVSRPTIIAFVPSEVRDKKDDGAVEGVAHTNFAVEDTAKCLSSKKVEFRFFFADRLVVRNGKSRTSFKVSSLGQGFGAILVEPGRPAKIVHSEDGPSTLQFLLPNAAAEYWQVPACKVAG